MRKVWVPKIPCLSWEDHRQVRGGGGRGQGQVRVNYLEEAACAGPHVSAHSVCLLLGRPTPAFPETRVGGFFGFSEFRLVGVPECILVTAASSLGGPSWVYCVCSSLGYGNSEPYNMLSR